MAKPTAVNVHEAKTRLSQLLVEVQRGKEVIIAKAGRPVARLAAYRSAAKPIAAPGSLEGRGYWIAEDFDAPMDTLFEAFSARTA